MDTWKIISRNTTTQVRDVDEYDRGHHQASVALQPAALGPRSPKLSSEAAKARAAQETDKVSCDWSAGGCNADL